MAVKYNEGFGDAEDDDCIAIRDDDRVRGRNKITCHLVTKMSNYSFL